MSTALRWCLALGLVLAPAACGGGGNGPMDPPDDGPLDVSGNYAATFAGVAENCGGLVPDGSATGTLIVIQNGSAVTLEITDLNESILSDPTGTIDADGNFTFQGPITVGNAEGTLDAQGTIQGTFTQDGEVDLTFSFSAFTCEVTGTIEGQQ